MFVHYRTKGFVLKKDDRGEADQLFMIYTEDFGKLEVLGKAIRKIKSKLRGSLDLFHLSEIEFIQGKAYKTLTDAILTDGFKNLRKDAKRLKIAYQIADLLDDLIGGQEADEKIWKLLNEVFERLNSLKIEDCKLKIIYYYFFWNLVSFLGYQPELYLCSLCQKKITPKIIYFSGREGGLVCPDCSSGASSAEEIKPEVVKIIRLFLGQDWKTLSRLKFESRDENSLRLASRDYLRYVLGEIK